MASRKGEFSCPQVSFQYASKYLRVLYKYKDYLKYHKGKPSSIFFI